MLDIKRNANVHVYDILSEYSYLVNIKEERLIIYHALISKSLNISWILINGN